LSRTFPQDKRKIMSSDQRAALARLIEERREEYASLSRLLGRNPAYIQQFIKRGIPKKLDEADRRLLAQYFGVDEEVLGGPSSTAPAQGELVSVPRLDVEASAGPGAMATGERPLSHIAFQAKWLREVTAGAGADLSLITVRGDSMAPTITEGDDILVDRSEPARRLRDSIYVIRREDTLLVKRIALGPSSRHVTVRSDNEAYPSWPDVPLKEIDVVGRVVWIGRKLR
jgi:phage repressor protein C with HTH and peptisase S24 domain